MSQITDSKQDVIAVPSAEELAAYGHDFSALTKAAAERLSQLAEEILNFASTEPRGEVTIEEGLSVADYCKRWVQGLETPLVELQQWPDDQQEAIVQELEHRWSNMRKHSYFDLRVDDVAAWLIAHRPAPGCGVADVNDRQTAVIECIRVVPPREVRVKRRLAQTGMQKVVFEATWSLGNEQRRVVLKRLLKEGKASDREARAHPLVMRHPNIVQTYTVKNELRPPSTFFLETYMSVLDDDWLATGHHEAARLIADMARALAFLNGQGLVHGDVKPDNIGSREGRYVLLDFGVSRPWIEFLGGGKGTGSTRTRAPEVLAGAPNSEHSDVWSLGATVFRFLFQRFPLFESRSEEPPALLNATPTQRRLRARFRRKLRKRAKNEWVKYVTSELRTLKKENLRLGELLEDMLAYEPDERPSASEVLDRALHYLGSLVGEAEGPLFPPTRELAQFCAYTTDRAGLLRTIPRPKQGVWDERVTELEQELSSEQAERYFQSTIDQCCNQMLGKPLSPGARAAIERVQEEVKLRQDDPPLYEDLLSEVRFRLAIAAGREHAQPKTRERREDALSDAIDSALAFPEIEHLQPNFAPVAKALQQLSRTALP